MPANQRIKGQEFSLTFTGPNGVEEAFAANANAEITTQLDLLSEGYLGETSNRRDDIFNGLSGSVEMHLQTNDYWKFLRRVKDRAQRRSPASGQFNFTGVFNFPNGQRERVVLEDVFFGNQPVTIGGRGEYITVKIEFECQDGRFL